MTFKNTVLDKASMAPQCSVMGGRGGGVLTSNSIFFKYICCCCGWIGVVSVCVLGLGLVFERKTSSVMVLDMIEGKCVLPHWSDLAFFGPVAFLEGERGGRDQQRLR